MKNPLSLILYPLSRISLLLCLAFAGLFPTAAPADELTRGLVGWWRLDGRLVDESGNGNNATVGAGSAAYAAGKFGQAWDNDDTRYLVLPSAAAVRNTSEFTLIFWLNGSLNNIRIFQQSLSGSETNPSLGFTTSATTLILSGRPSNSGDNIIFATVPISDVPSGWVMLSATYNSTTNVSRIFANGQIISTGTAPAAYVNFTPARGPLVGASIVFANHFIGQIQNLTIHNRALAAHEIRALYALGSPVGLTP